MITGKCCNCGHVLHLQEFRMGPGQKGLVPSKEQLRKNAKALEYALKQARNEK